MSDDRGKCRKTKAPKARANKKDPSGRVRSELTGIPDPVGLGPDYEVGYGKPPVATCFRKGVSGNPAGRPKRKKQQARSQHQPAASGPAMRALREELTRDLVVQEAGEAKSMPLAQTALRHLQKLAFQGSMNASKESCSGWPWKRPSGETPRSSWIMPSGPGTAMSLR